MEFGMFHEFPTLSGRTESEAFDEAMEQVDAAERLGLDVMWLAELHFEPRRSVLSAPLSIASAIAGRTRRIKIGIAVQVLPLCHPLRLAEEAATVDQLSHGRLIFGVGRSGVAQTYEAYGVSYAESRERFREILDIVEQAWTKPSFSYEGKYHRFKDVAVVPKPYQKPTPPIRIAASTPDTFPAIGRRGAAIFASVRHTTWPDLAKQIRTYHEAWEEAGHPGRGQVFVSAPTYLAETEERARSEPKESIMHF
jgi:alkanesulfonate monooxygenase SsuD/methylene tetrahydromethanopterin reductase-like flavin-dependent oxidoreductase (luciferase family)